MDVAGAVSFIEEHGTGLEKARIRHILHGASPEPAVVRPFIELQNADGGFPFRLLQGNPSTLNNTHGALLRMDDLGMLGSSAARRALEYLVGAQRDDGGWDENETISEYDPPPWASPGEPRARAYLSALSTFWLAVGGYSDHSTFENALGFLRERQRESGRYHGFLHTTWIATSVFLMAGDRYSEVARKGLEALMAQPLSEWVDSQISWALQCLGKAGLSRDEPFVERSLAELIRRQGLDGEWTSEDGEARAVGAVIGVLRVLKHYHVLPRV